MLELARQAALSLLVLGVAKVVAEAGVKAE